MIRKTSVLGLPLLIALCLLGPQSSARARTQENKLNFKVRVALELNALHLAVQPVGDYVLLSELGEIVGRMASGGIYFIDVDPEGLAYVRDQRGRAFMQEIWKAQILPTRVATDSLRIQAIEDVSDWNSNQLARADHYRGAVEIVRDGAGLAVINHVELESYLYGVVAAEIGPLAPMEALKAQAVAARSETVAKIKRGIVAANPLYDFENTPMYQVYRGKGRETDWVRRAVDETRGMILTWDGMPVDAVYCHSCGGVIAGSTDIWEGSDVAFSERKLDGGNSESTLDLSSWVRAHEATTQPMKSFCNPDQPGFPNYAKKHYRWSQSYTTDQLSQLLDYFYKTGPIESLSVVRRTKSGRVRALHVRGERRSVTISKELEIRRALGGLRSVFFTMTNELDASGGLRRVNIHGAGFGHGVGMCQMGALMMANRGMDYRQIVGHYFSGTTLENLYL